jgi:cation:H+ antiporter
MDYLKFISGLALLILSAKYLVQGGVSIAKYFKMSNLVIGLTIVAIGTSAPELIVSVNAAISGNPEIALGNVVGSNIVNIAFILAITAILMPIPVDRSSVRLDWPVMMLASVLLYVFILDNEIVFYEGFIFFSLLVAYTVFLLRKSKKDSLTLSKNEPDDIAKVKQMGVGLALIVIILSSVGLAFGADFMVDGASSIAEKMGVSKRVISLTIVAIGTSAPELTASLMAAFRKETDIAIGNIIGSNIFNIFAVLGITSMIHPIFSDHIAFSFDIIWMLFIAILLFLFIYPFKTVYLNRAEGLILFIAFLIYMFMLIFGYDFESITNSFSSIL